MLFGQPCSKCGHVGPAFQRHQCRPTRPHRPELGPRIPGPGFAMRWVRRSFYFGSIEKGPTWIESTNPLREATRAFRPVAIITRECIEHDRKATLVKATAIHHRGLRARLVETSRQPRRFRAWLRAFTRIASASRRKDDEPRRLIFDDPITGAKLWEGAE